MVIATGAATIAVAVLLRTSDNVIVTTISTVQDRPGRPALGQSAQRPGDQRGAPRGSSAAPSGIIEPSRTTTGHSIRS
jgi:hypothetical protein